MKMQDVELEIFSRQLILNEFNEKSFLELQNKKVTIIGMGGGGLSFSTIFNFLRSEKFKYF